MNIIETIKRFPDQSSCIDYLEGLRWQGLPECPYCNSKRSSKRQESQRHICNSCNRSYSVLVGTVFEGTKLPLPQWFLAISLMLNAKKGLSARQLSRDL
ncbi:transposase, partial [Mucilaginibacter gossypii]